MNIELRHLRYFVAVAEELHFGRAAARLNISQPPLSQQIQILEQQVGRVLARTNRSVSLTAAGKQFLADSRQILSMVDDAAARAERLYLGKPENCASGLPRPRRLSAPSRKRSRRFVVTFRMFIFRRAKSTPANRLRR
jgi:DNA-binding transcriptional LysR family regulator